jgi:putative peptidoglycan lipid II flippase
MGTSAELIQSNTASHAMETEETAKGVAKATGVIALGNISSRVLGLFREVILSNLFGTSAAVDAFKIAVIVPRGLYDLLIGGHVNSALVPVLSEYAAHKNRRDLWELVNILLGWVTIGLIGLVLLIELLAGWIIRVVANEKTPPETLDQATDLLRITAPALFFLSLFAVISGLLYALKRFTLPAFGASLFNGTIVVVTLLFTNQIGITAVALGWLIGAIVQLGVQLPALRDARIYPSFKRMVSHPGIRTIGLLYIPVLFSLALDVLINRPFSYNLASGTGEGNIGIMEWATTLIQFPHGLVATAISVAVLPTLSQQAMNKTQEGIASFKNTLGLGLRLATVLILPATIGLFVMATPVIALIFEHGAFTASDTAITAIVLRLYLIGLPFAVIDLILIFAFYAHQDTLTPALIGLLSLIAYMITAVVLLPLVGFYSLMIADSVKHVIHSSVSAWLLWRKIGGLQEQKLLSNFIRTVFATSVMGIGTFGVYQGLVTIFGDANFILEILYVLIPTSVGAGIFLTLGHWIHLAELRWLMGLVQQRLRRVAS